MWNRETPHTDDSGLDLKLELNTLQQMIQSEGIGTRRQIDLDGAKTRKQIADSAKGIIFAIGIVGAIVVSKRHTIVIVK